MNESTEICTCVRCEKEFTAPAGTPRWMRWNCPPCQEIEDAKEHAKQEDELNKRRSAYWESLCPELFKGTDLAHPEFKTSLHAKVMEWKPTSSKPWVGIVGKKGASKSRIAFLRLQAAIMADEGPQGWGTADFCTAYEFAESVQFKFAKGEEGKTAKASLRDARNSRFLLFDDVGKARATPAVIDGLFALFDHRYANMLPTIWTANSTPEEFCEGMPPDVAGPLVRRLKEASTLFAIQ